MCINWIYHFYKEEKLTDNKSRALLKLADHEMELIRPFVVHLSGLCTMRDLTCERYCLSDQM